MKMNTAQLNEQNEIRLRVRKKAKSCLIASDRKSI